MKTKTVNGINIPYITKRIFFLFSVPYFDIINQTATLVVYFTSFEEAMKIKNTTYKGW